MAAKKSDYRHYGKKSSGQYEEIPTGKIISRRTYDNLFHRNQKVGTYNVQQFRYLERLWDKVAALPDDTSIIIRAKGMILFYDGKPKQWITVRANIYKDTLMRLGYDSIDNDIETNMNDVSGFALLWK